jgi:hypothetical protein
VSVPASSSSAPSQLHYGFGWRANFSTPQPVAELSRISGQSPGSRALSVGVAVRRLLEVPQPRVVVAIAREDRPVAQKVFRTCASGTQLGIPYCALGHQGGPDGLHAFSSFGSVHAAIILREIVA